MEAAAMGVPVVASDIRGCRQVVDHDRTGLLFPVRDADALARALTRVANDAQLRARMGTVAVAKAEADFDQARVIDRTRATYERLLATAAC
jgi:glycosyltransferase involved in cell wall biosynthesis